MFNVVLYQLLYQLLTLNRHLVEYDYVTLIWGAVEKHKIHCSTPGLLHSFKCMWLDTWSSISTTNYIWQVNFPLHLNSIQYIFIWAWHLASNACASSRGALGHASEACKKTACVSFLTQFVVSGCSMTCSLINYIRCLCGAHMMYGWCLDNCWMLPSLCL